MCWADSRMAVSVKKINAARNICHQARTMRRIIYFGDFASGAVRSMWMGREHTRDTGLCMYVDANVVCVCSGWGSLSLLFIDNLLDRLLKSGWGPWNSWSPSMIDKRGGKNFISPWMKTKTPQCSASVLRLSVVKCGPRTRPSPQLRESRCQEGGQDPS